jgi:hypothetical protein
MEKVHGPWAVDQLQSDLEKVGVTAYEVVSDDITARTRGGSYAILKKTDAGYAPILIPNDDGVLIQARFEPDYASSEQAFRDEKEKKKLLGRAKELREKGGFSVGPYRLKTYYNERGQQLQIERFGADQVPEGGGGGGF